MHAHIDVCPGCVAFEKAREQAKDVAGAHVRLASGTKGSCERCLGEFHANRAVTPPPT